MGAPASRMRVYGRPHTKSRAGGPATTAGSSASGVSRSGSTDTPASLGDDLRDGLVVRARDLAEEAVDGERWHRRRVAPWVVYQSVTRSSPDGFPGFAGRMPTVTSTERGRAAGRSRTSKPGRERFVSVHKVRMAGIVAALGAVAVLGATTFASGPAITDAGSANTKTAGISLPDKLSPQWRETTVAQGSTALENPSALTSWYGYYNDGPMIPAPGDVQATGPQRRGDQERAGQEHVPRRQGPARRRPEVRLRHALPLPGSRARHGRRRLHHAHQPRRRRGAPRDEARRDRGRRQDAGARDRRLDLGSVRAAPALHHRGRRRAAASSRRRSTTRPRSRTSGACSGQGGFEGIQNDKHGNVYIVEDSGGPAGKVNTHAKQPNSFIYRLLPYDPTNLDAGGKLQVLQVESLEHAGPIVFGERPRRGHPLGRHQGSAHLRPRLQDAVGHDPRHQEGRHGGLRRQRGGQEGRRHALQAARRTACSSRAPASRSSSSRRPATPR